MDVAAPGDAGKTIAVHAALVGNPATPWEILRGAGPRFPERFFANPVFPLLMLENPQLPLAFTQTRLERLLQAANAPAAFVRPLMRQSVVPVAQAATYHRAIFAGVTDQWAAWAAEALRQRRFPSPFLYGPRMRQIPLFRLQGVVPAWLLAILGRHVQPELLALATIIPEFPAQDAMRVRRNPDVRGILDEAEYRTPEWPRLVMDVSRELRRAAANPRTPPEQLAAFSRAPQPGLRWSVAVNYATPTDLIARLAADPISDVALAAASHPAAPASMQRHVYGRILRENLPIAGPFYRLIAFAGPLLAPEVLARHCSAPDWAERYALARNLRTPLIALARLADDGVILVAQAARATLRGHVVVALGDISNYS
jgi:hypothetical protein